MASVASAEWKVSPEAMVTRWGKQVTPQNAWQEYPRPQFRRDENWENLNGLWKFAISQNGAMPHDYQGDILVPFPIESALSGVQRLLAPDETLWYRRMFTHQTRGGHRTHLHFEAVDYECTVYLNGKKIGSHKGSSDPFKFDITDALRPGDNELTVSVIDQTAPSQTLGKQSLKPKGIYYTRVSGIWQTVWLEDVPQRHFRMVKMKPRIAESTLRVLPTLEGKPLESERIVITVRDGERVVGVADAALSVRIPNAKLWSPRNPSLYDITMELFDGEELIDRVESYAAMREIGTVRGPGGQIRMTLNGKVDIPLRHIGSRLVA
jgi:beta-galactosidase